MRHIISLKRYFTLKHIIGTALPLFLLFFFLSTLVDINWKQDKNQGLLNAASKIDRQAEKRREKQKKTNREMGFQDIEIDNLHGAIERRVYILNALIDSDIDTLKKAGEYSQQEDVYEIDINTEMRRFTEPGFIGKIPPGKLKIDRDIFIRKLSEFTGNISKAKKVFSMPLGLGITVPEGRKRFLYKTYVHLFTNDSAKDLLGIMIQFDRVNATGYTYVAERRLVVNPNPEDKVLNPETNYYIDSFEFAQIQNVKKEKPKKIKETKEFDYNGDIFVEFYSAMADKDDFAGKPIYTERLVWEDYATNPLHNPMPYSKQLLLIEGYKKYLRRTQTGLDQAIRDYDLKRRDRMGRMMQFLHSAK
jgi:hypothetical protein